MRAATVAGMDTAVVFERVAPVIPVRDLDAALDRSRAGVPGRLGEPGDRPYGLREFGYVDPDGTLHRVGSPLLSS